MSDPNDSTNTGDGASLSSTFLELYVKVRSNDPSILPEVGKPFQIRRNLSEREDIKLAGALMENTSVTCLLGADDGKLYEKLCRGNDQVRAYQQALASLDPRLDTR
jgi:hypothetical protein